MHVDNMYMQGPGNAHTVLPTHYASDTLITVHTTAPECNSTCKVQSTHIFPTRTSVNTSQYRYTTRLGCALDLRPAAM